MEALPQQQEQQRNIAQRPEGKAVPDPDVVGVGTSAREANVCHPCACLVLLDLLH